VSRCPLRPASMRATSPFWSTRKKCTNSVPGVRAVLKNGPSALEMMTRVP
jgi:hypothetical protein